jgi:hypothetical protein
LPSENFYRIRPDLSGWNCTCKNAVSDGQLNSATF